MITTRKAHVYIPAAGTNKVDIATPEAKQKAVQAVWRGFYARWEGPAAEVIQRWYRGHLARRYVRALRQGRLLNHQLAALDAKAVKAWLQGASWLRRASKGLKHTAAHNAKISAALKGKTLTAATKAKLSAALKGKPNAKLAAALKGKTLTAAHKAKISAAMKKKKGKTAASGERSRVEQTAAVVIQRHWRGLLARRLAAERRKAATDIQRWWKGYRARKDWPRLRLRWRALKHYATDIQRWVRGHLTRLKVRKLRAARLPQSRASGPAVDDDDGSEAAARQRRRDAAAATIQAHWRGLQARKRRAWLKREAAKRQRYERRLAAAQVLQAHFRGWRVRRAVGRLRAAGPLAAGSLSGGLVAAPGIAGDTRDVVVLPYGNCCGRAGSAAVSAVAPPQERWSVVAGVEVMGGTSAWTRNWSAEEG
eukprot:XP_001692300.1 predicted protein [Chlamydomonas reinhardtii]